MDPGSRPLAERLARHKALADLGSPVIDQAFTARLLPRLSGLTSAGPGRDAQAGAGWVSC